MLDRGHGAFRSGKACSGAQNLGLHVSSKQQLIECGSGELMAEGFETSSNSLSEITGNITSDELLGEIFRLFALENDLLEKLG